MNDRSLHFSNLVGQRAANAEGERKYHGTSARRDRASCFRRACLSDPRTSFLSRGRLNRTLRTQAGHASVNLDGGHAAPDSLSVRRGGSHCARMPLRTKRSKSPSSCAASPPLSFSLCLSSALERGFTATSLPQSLPLQSIRHQRRMDSRAIGPAQSDIGIYGAATFLR